MSNNFSFLTYKGTGVYNFRSLNVRHIRRLNMSRGGREGNNALCKENGPINIHSSGIACWVMSEPNLSISVVEKLMEVKVLEYLS